MTTPINLAWPVPGDPLRSMLAWTQHWQDDVSAGVKPSMETLASAIQMLTDVIALRDKAVPLQATTDEAAQIISFGRMHDIPTASIVGRMRNAGLLDVGRVPYVPPAPAPDMLAALEGVLWMAEEWFKYSGCDTTCADEYRRDLDAANAAISKASSPALQATGEQS